MIWILLDSTLLVLHPVPSAFKWNRTKCSLVMAIYQLSLSERQLKYKLSMTHKWKQHTSTGKITASIITVTYYCLVRECHPQGLLQGETRWLFSPSCTFHRDWELHAQCCHYWIFQPWNISYMLWLSDAMTTSFRVYADIEHELCQHSPHTIEQVRQRGPMRSYLGSNMLKPAQTDNFYI